MLKEKLFGSTVIPMLSKGLDAFAMRHRAISDNVANIETKGYNRRQVNFEEKLQALLRKDGLVKTNSNHLGRGKTFLSDSKKMVNRNQINTNLINPELSIDRTKSDINDINNVDIDQEMGDMAKNHLKYTFAVKMGKHKFDGIKSSIRGM